MHDGQYNAEAYMLGFFEHIPINSNITPVRAAMKTLMDYIGALCALVIFSPVMLWAAYRIKKEYGVKHIFTFSQEPGKTLCRSGCASSELCARML